MSVPRNIPPHDIHTGREWLISIILRTANGVGATISNSESIQGPGVVVWLEWGQSELNALDSLEQDARIWKHRARQIEEMPN